MIWAKQSLILAIGSCTEVIDYDNKVIESCKEAIKFRITPSTRTWTSCERHMVNTAATWWGKV